MLFSLSYRSIYGPPGWICTTDARLFRAALYSLSYRGVCWSPGQDLNLRSLGCNQLPWATWLPRLIWSGRLASLQRPPASKAGALLAELLPDMYGGSGRTRTHNGFTRNCFQDSALIQPDHFPIWRKEKDSNLRWFYPHWFSKPAP